MGVKAFAWALRMWRRVRRWREQLARPRRLTPGPAEELSFLPTPGPGDSDGGDIFPP
jgi:hypothetical protein